VKRYVDANIAEVKDFVGEIVKKLPTPSRLAVQGTLRKTLILYFVCVHTGREFPIESHDWNKWLKIGFSLVKLGKMVVDCGIGNPLSLVGDGVDTVKAIYEAYKQTDDKDFNTYITQPFLTSTESDDLINKLRDQGFFEKFQYDKQAGGWYLTNPEKDGLLPGAAAGSVTKTAGTVGGEAKRLIGGALAQVGIDMNTAETTVEKPAMTAEQAAAHAYANSPAGKAAAAAAARQEGAGVSSSSPLYSSSPSTISTANSGPSSAEFRELKQSLDKTNEVIQKLEKRITQLEARPQAKCLVA